MRLFAHSLMALRWFLASGSELLMVHFAAFSIFIEE
jgi:hypothetical protein